MAGQLSMYKERTIQANVPNHPGKTSFTGDVTIIKDGGGQTTEQRLTPNWVKPAQSVSEAEAILTQYAKDVIDGKAQQGSDVNG